MNEILIALAGIVSAGGTGYFGFLFAKSKYKQEVEKLRVEIQKELKNNETIAIENDIKLSSHYKVILDDLKERYENRFREFEDMMNRKNNLLEEEIKLKDRKIKLQQVEIAELKKENKALRAHAKSSLT